MENIQITNPQMQKIFETQFHSNQEKFVAFIFSFVKDNTKLVDEYFQKVSNPQKIKSFSFKKQNPMENFYTLEKDETTIKETNPFSEVKDSLAFAKQLREDSYR